MLKPKTQMTITYYSGETQIIKPDMNKFDGEWAKLAKTIAGPQGYERIKIS